MVSINNIRASDGTGPAAKATVGSARAISATTITVDTVSHWPANFIAATGTPDLTTGLITTATIQVFYGHLSGGTIIIDSFASGYTDKGNSSGDIVVLKPTTAWAKEVANLLAVSLNDDGTLNTAATTAAQTAIQASTNFRPKPRLSTATSVTTLTPNIDTYNIYGLTAQAAALTVAAPTGTPNNGDVIIIRIRDNGTSQTITWNAAYINVSGLDTIVATTANKWHYIGLMYSAADSAWHVISISTGA